MVILKNDKIALCDITKIIKICNKLEVNLHLKEEDVTVKMFANGNLNTLYHVKIHANLPTSVPRTLVVKLITTSSQLPFDLTSTNFTNVLLGQSGLGPQIYLVDSSAIIMEFFPGRILNLYDDQEPEFRKAVATKLAQFHSQSFQIEHNQHETFLSTIFNVWLSEAILADLNSGKMQNILLQFECKNLVDIEKFKEEVEYVKNIIVSNKEQGIVFAHNDFNHSNILVLEREEDEEEIELKFVDFDFSRYFYRGADFGRYFLDYRDPNIEDTESSPDASCITESVMLEYITYYRQECAQIYGSEFRENPVNSADNILRESKVFMLYASLLNIVMATWVAYRDQEETRDGCLIWADMCFGRYLRLKEQFKTEGIVP